MMGYRFCINCTGFPAICNLETDFPACSSTAAQSTADSMAQSYGNDCKATKCTGSDTGPACTGGTGGTDAGSGGTGGTATGTGGTAAGTGGTAAGTGGTDSSTGGDIGDPG
jgi:hypothetical protein